MAPRPLQSLEFRASPTTDPAQMALQWKMKTAGHLVVVKSAFCLRGSGLVYEKAADVLWDWVLNKVSPTTLFDNPGTDPAARWVEADLP